MIGNLLYRGGAFLLLPLYTRLLTPADFGTLELISVTTFLFQTLLSSGVAHATLRFYFEDGTQEDRNAIITTSLAFSLLLTAAGASVLCFAAPALSTLVFGSAVHALALRLMFVTMVLEISREINLAFVRAREQSTLFVAMSIVQLLVQVTANIVTVWYLRLGIVGVLVGNLTATAAIWVVLTRATLKTCGWRVRPERMWRVLRYGAPIMASSIVDSAVKSADRYILNAYTGLSIVGLCAVAVKIASVPGILLIQPFTTSFGPFRFAIMKHPDAQKVYARVLHYYVFVATFVVLGICVLSREIITVVAGPAFRSAYPLVPPFVAASALGGVVYCFQTGVYIQKRTGHVFYNVVIGGLIYLSVLRLLVPHFGAYGVAAAGLTSYAFNVLYFYFVAQRLYPIDYQLGRLVRLVWPAIAIGVATLVVPTTSLWLSVPAKALLVSTYPLAAWLAGAIPPDEIALLRGAWRTLRVRAAALVGEA
jgi:O-antigen/teichoic acid export membrane protein